MKLKSTPLAASSAAIKKPAASARRTRTCGIAVPLPAQLGHRRNRGVSGTETLHAATLVINADQQLGLAQRADLGGQPSDLLGRFVVAREQNDCADTRVQQPRSIILRQALACDIEHDRSEWQLRAQVQASSTTTAQAMLRSWDNVT